MREQRRSPYRHATAHRAPREFAAALTGGNVESKERFPHSHRHDYDYGCHIYSQPNQTRETPKLRLSLDKKTGAGQWVFMVRPPLWRKRNMKVTGGLRICIRPFECAALSSNLIVQPWKVLTYIRFPERRVQLLCHSSFASRPGGRRREPPSASSDRRKPQRDEPAEEQEKALSLTRRGFGFFPWPVGQETESRLWIVERREGEVDRGHAAPRSSPSRQTCYPRTASLRDG